MVLALEMAIVYKMFWWALLAGIAGILIALFPSNFEIRGMDEPPELATEEE